MANPNFIATLSSNEIWRDLDDTRCITDDLDAIEEDISELQTGKADNDHSHSGYANATHTHTEYAPTSHPHSYNELSDKPTIPTLPFTEDTTYPGCFYRTVNGVIEWINPPMIVGEEYQTTNRCDGKTVYAKRINFGALPNNTVKSVYAFNGEWYRVVELKGMMVDSRNTWLVEPLPNSQVRLFAHNEYVKIQTDADMTYHTAYIDVKYTKD